MLDIPNKIFDVNIKNINAGLSDIYLYTKDEIEDAQIGFRVDNKGNKIEDWIGDNYVVIGNDSCCGDPIITDLSNEKLPVYNMFHDDWSSLRQISIDFEQYIEILNKIDEADIGNENEKDKLISYIKAIVPEEGIEYWESLIQVGYEFLNDID
jgi:hypothetical protein